MLTEEFVASVGPSSGPVPTAAIKDAAIIVHEFQPLLSQRAVFKKSTTRPQCLAISTKHVFAAQAEKAVIHVYDRVKGNQEVTVPFTERISCISLACNDAVLVIGTVEGRIILWETATGRQVSTARSHLQTITSLAVDATSNFLVSTSADSTVHIWSIPGLLSFVNAAQDSPTPIASFTGHRAGVVAVAIGHSVNFANIVVTIAKDKTCLVWDLHTATLLRTFLLPEIPTALTLDPADRAVYIGYVDGSLQQIDLFSTSSQPSRPVAVLSDEKAAVPIQPPSSTRWRSNDTSHGAVLSISLSFDGSILLTGQESGQILSWEVGRRAFRSTVLQHPLPGPVTNVDFLPVIHVGMATTGRDIAIGSIVKPKFGAFDTAAGFIPADYTFHGQLLEPSTDEVRLSENVFHENLASSCFEDILLDEGLGELHAWRSGPAVHTDGTSENDDDFMALDSREGSSKVSMEKENNELKAQIDALRSLQSASFLKIEQLAAERRALLAREQRRAANDSTSTDESD